MLTHLVLIPVALYRSAQIPARLTNININRELTKRVFKRFMTDTYQSIGLNVEQTSMS